MENQAEFNNSSGGTSGEKIEDSLDRTKGSFDRVSTSSTIRVDDLAGVFDHILGPARQLSAAVQGNLQALAGNIQAWSPEIQEQVLENSRADLAQMCKYLDMGLTFTKVIRQSSNFKRSLRLIDLLEEIVEDLGYSSVKISEIPGQNRGPVHVKVDPELTEIAFRSLFRSIVNRNPASQNYELQISEDDNSVMVRISSPRILVLPGLAPDNEGIDHFEMDLEVFLAGEILSAQGGDLTIGRRTAGDERDFEVIVHLLTADIPRVQSINPDWREEFGRGAERILLAESQQEYQLPIREALADLGYRVDLAVEGSAVLDSIQSGRPRLVILARDLPGMDGLLVTQGVRRWSTVPIIMISRRESVDDLLYAYRLGVDDYLRKPFLIEELLVKTRVLLARSDTAQGSILPEVYQAGSIRIDYAARQIWVRGDLVELTPIEYNLLVYLSRQGRQIIPYEQLLEHVWEGPEKGTRQGLFVHVRRLREKIEEDPKNPLILRNKWGVGYEFNP